MLEAVAVSWSAAERYATSAEVIWLVVNMSRDGKVTFRGTLCTEPSSCNTNHVERCIRTMPL